MLKRCLLMALMIILLSLGANASTIYGTVYDDSLNKLDNVMLEINTEPKQTLVSKDGTYSFEVPEGDYLLTAKFYEDDFLKLKTSEDISVPAEGKFIVDLILFESLDDELLETSDIEIEGISLEQEDNYTWLIIVFLAIILGFVIFFKFVSKRENAKIEDDDLKKIVSIIKDNGGRIKQRDLRKKFPLSEAKVSLMITELEHEGKIKKIKKGRGNILILQK